MLGEAPVHRPHVISRPFVTHYTSTPHNHYHDHDHGPYHYHHDYPYPACA